MLRVRSKEQVRRKHWQIIIHYRKGDDFKIKQKQKTKQKTLPLFWMFLKSSKKKKLCRNYWI